MDRRIIDWLELELQKHVISEPDICAVLAMASLVAVMALLITAGVDCDKYLVGVGEGGQDMYVVDVDYQEGYKDTGKHVKRNEDIKETKVSAKVDAVKAKKIDEEATTSDLDDQEDMSEEWGDWEMEFTK